MSPGTQQNDRGEGEKPFWRQPGPLLSAGVLLVAAVIGGFVVLADDDGDAKAAPGPAAPSAPPAQGTPPGEPSDAAQEGRPAGCRTDDSDQATPPKSPADLKWKVYQSEVVPVSATAGPLMYDGAVWSCFARTPLGAVLAAHSIASKMGGSDWRTVVEKQFTRGPGTEALKETRAGIPDESSSATPDGDGAYAGFNLITYDKDRATTRTLMRFADGAYATGTISVVWEDGDWKLRPTLSGSITESITPISGPAGFVLWGNDSSG
ncbi:hypothetical protein [Streptomyces californicus]|uniref:hypothetical protein n=1 Tax=Streptomyces californicus TaxID=67351 RepID=UPI0037A7E16F